MHFCQIKKGNVRPSCNWTSSNSME